MLLLACGLSGSLWALPVSGLYSDRVAVANESDADRQRAFREALEAVVLKVTGDPRWLEHQDVVRAARNAQSFVEAISYSSEMVAAPVADLAAAAEPEEPGAANSAESTADQPADAASAAETSADQPSGPVQPQFREQRFINVSFAENLINQLLVSADIPIWDSNRPSVLVWMVLQDPSGEREMLTADSHPQIMALIRDFASRRGVPIIFPLLDFEDRRSLGEDQVWALETDAIRAASARYGADSVLAGRVYFTAGGEMVGLWQFLFQDQVEIFDGFDSDLQNYLFAPLNRITSQLAGYFAITPESTRRQQVALRVDGVDNLQAYSGLLNYLGNLGLVESVVTTALQGARIELRLSLLGNAQQLNELIALDRDLLPITDRTDAASGAVDSAFPLHYRWTR